MTRGFVLGKFMPVHTGHLFLIEAANKLVDQLTVLVCTRDCEPIDGDLRYQWVQSSVEKSVRVLHLHREIPQEPADHPDFWAIWQTTINTLHPESIDVVFGSEAYINTLAEVLLAAPIIIDLERESVPVSATAIRQSPTKNWKFVPKVVRPYYQKKISILGAESTGKTTLCTLLAKHYNTKCIPEYGRTYDASVRDGKDWQVDDFVTLARTHRAIADTIVGNAGAVVFEDTDLLQTIMWAEYLLGVVPKELEALITKWKPATHYFLLAPNVEWIDDGTRYSGDMTVREQFFSRLHSLLTRYQCSFSIIDNANFEDRYLSAKTKLDEMLG